MSSNKVRLPALPSRAEAAPTDPLASAFFATEEAAPTPAPAKRPAAPANRPTPPAPAKAPTKKMPTPTSTAGIPLDEANAAGLKGSQVFGQPPPKSGGPVAAPVGLGPAKAAAPTPTAKRPAAAPTASKASAPASIPTRVPGATTKSELGPEYERQVAIRREVNETLANITDPMAAAVYVEGIWATPYAKLEAVERAVAFECMRRLLLDYTAKHDMMRALLADTVALTINGEGEKAPQLGDLLAPAGGELGQQGDEADSLADAFGDILLTPESSAPRPTYITFPSGVRMTFEQFVGAIKRYPKMSLAQQGETDRGLFGPQGDSISKVYGYNSLKNESQEETRDRLAREMATRIVEGLGQPAPPDGPDGGGADPDDDDEYDDGSEVGEEETGEEGEALVISGPVTDPSIEYEPGYGPTSQVTSLAEARARKGGGPATAPLPTSGPREQAFQGAKVTLAQRADNFVCYRPSCGTSSRHHKGLVGPVTTVHEGQTVQICAGFLAKDAHERAALDQLVGDMTRFKEEYADLIGGQQGGASAATKSGGSGNVGGAAGPHAPAASAGQPTTGARAGSHVEGARGPVRGGPAAPIGQGGGTAPESAGDGSVQGGSETPAYIRELGAIASVRAGWVKEQAAEIPTLTDALTWGVNYPPPSFLPVPAALDTSAATVEKRKKVVTYVRKHLAQLFTVKDASRPDGLALRGDLALGSLSWRVFVAARRLAFAVEEFSVNHDPQRNGDLQNTVDRAIKDYVLAHKPLPEEIYDPNFRDYVEWCAYLGLSIGTDAEEVAEKANTVETEAQ